MREIVTSKALLFEPSGSLSHEIGAGSRAAEACGLDHEVKWAHQLEAVLKEGEEPPDALVTYLRLCSHRPILYDA